MRFVALVVVVSISGGSGGGTLAIFDPVVTVTSSSTITSGSGASDWVGRASIKRRPTDDALVMVYYRGEAHATNVGALHIRFSSDDGATWTAEDTKLAGGLVDGFPMNPPVTAGQDAGEPWLYVAPNDDLLIHMWRVDYAVLHSGSYQSRSTDGGESWSTPAAITFSGITDQANTFSTDDDFVFDQTIYAGVRTYTSAAETDANMSLVKSIDNGISWEFVSVITTTAEAACIEVGLIYTGHDTILAMIRDLAHTASYQRVSTDMGLTWGTLTNVTSTVGIAGRQRLHTRMQLMGFPGWWKDPVIIMNGFVHQVPGDSQTRRNAVWISPDRGTTWDGPHYVSASIEDAGYGDMFYDEANGRYVYVTYQGTLLAASLNQYNLTISGW